MVSPVQRDEGEPELPLEERMNRVA
ncbi:MAG: hypothetical protein QOG85_1028, partial [Gaiellaceae bacterium]|nr:hypothetical protein [Gaiellaceae bacterium]